MPASDRREPEVWPLRLLLVLALDVVFVSEMMFQVCVVDEVMWVGSAGQLQQDTQGITAIQ